MNIQDLHHFCQFYRDEKNIDYDELLISVVKTGDVSILRQFNYLYDKISDIDSYLYCLWLANQNLDMISQLLSMKPSLKNDKKILKQLYKHSKTSEDVKEYIRAIYYKKYQ
jgi:hypothetical protein